jgi:ABC-type multidrug transport system ATPase subunit
MPPADPPFLSRDATVRVEARDLGFAWGDRPVFGGLDFVIGPGLSLVRGGDGRGKSTLLRLLAGELEPGSGRLLCSASGVFGPVEHDPTEDPMGARDWLAARRARHPDWDPALERALLEEFGLEEHLGKTLLMLSTGSRRKLGLVAAFASGAALVLIDTPFAGLDRPSSQRLTQRLAQAARHPSRAVVIADYDLPEGLPADVLGSLIELGD